MAAYACAASEKDTDADRGGATPIKTCGVVTDKIDVGAGDVSDFKLLQVPQGGVLSITVHWDNVRLQGQVSVQDKFGVILERKVRNPETNSDAINKPVEAGVYFIHVLAEDGASVYSLETSFKNLGGGGCGEENDPIPVIVELQRKGDKKPGSKDAGGGGGGGGGGAAAPPPPPAAAIGAPMAGGMGGGMAPQPGFGSGQAFGAGGGEGGFSAGFEDGAAGGAEDEFPEPPGPKHDRRGEVLRISQAREGGAELTVGLGRSSGVKTGVRGALLTPGGKPMRGATVVVVKVWEEACRVRTSYPADQIPDGAAAMLRTLR